MLGGSALPPFELPPLPSLVKTQGQAPLSVTDSKGSEKQKAAADAQSAAEKANSPFLSRTELEQKRTRCKIEFVGSPHLTAATKGDQLKLKFKNSGEPCLSAVASDEPWIDSVINSRMNVVLVLVEANNSDASRTAELSVIAGNSTFVFTVLQANRVPGCLRATARRGRAPVPDGFEP